MFTAALAAAATGCACAPGRPIAFHDKVEVTGPDLTLGALADLAGLPTSLRARAQRLSLSPAPRPDAKTLFSKAVLARRAVGQMPALAFWLRDVPAGAVEVVRGAEASADASPAVTVCDRVETPISAGQVIAVGALSPVPCERAAKPAFRFDPVSATARADRDLRPGDIVPELPGFAMAAVRAGERLKVATRVGPVALTREVQAVQPGRAGKPFFVKAADGAVFSTRDLEVLP